MTPFSTLAVGSAAALLLAAWPPAMASAPPNTSRPTVRLICPETIGPFCHALSHALPGAVSKRDVPEPDMDVRSGPARGPILTLTFVPEARTPHRLAGHLTWHRRDGVRTRGPTLEISVVDAVLNPDLLRDFATQLIRHSALPL